jgi:uncharacterized protein YwgA
MYFMQEAGEPLRLEYSKAHYGPYAENLRHVLNKIEGHFICGYGDAEDNPGVQIELKTEASQKAEQFLATHQRTHVRFDRVAELIRGFETPYGMELLATVHWVAKQEGASTPDEAVAKVHAWSERKKQFPAQHISIAWQMLTDQRWVIPRASN